ncbi:MAG: hypothetical protein ACRELB_26140, partial [Polyangiaceae bacterium]
MDARSYAAACAKFAESERLDPSAGTMLNLAVCHEHGGKLATAWAEYRDAETASRHANEAARATFADEHAKALESKLAHLTIRVPPGSDLTIQLDGAAIGPAAWGTPLPVDAGAHHIVALRGSIATWEASPEVHADGESQTLDVPSSAASERDQSAEGGRTAGTLALAGGRRLRRGRRGARGRYGLRRHGAQHSERPQGAGGVPGELPPSAQAQIDALHGQQWASDLGFGVGVVGLGVGVVLLLTSSAPE